jgi:hypothetical protein
MQGVVGSVHREVHESGRVEETEVSAMQVENSIKKLSQNPYPFIFEVQKGNLCVGS